jgi:aspartate kinase
VDWESTEKLVNAQVRTALEAGHVAVTQGFIGSTSDNETTTLGREGSDYSAAILSYCLDAESMSIWKDVPGVLTADPRLFDHVTKIDHLSYREAIEMTYYGAKVIHPKTIKPLQNKAIPLYVKSFIDPEGSGTRIDANAPMTYPPIITCDIRRGLELVTVRHADEFVVEQQRKGKMRFMNERVGNTVQMVLGNMEVPVRKG